MKLSTIVFSVVGVAFFALGSQAEPWPSKPVKVIVPAGAGSTIDIIPRIVFEQLSSQLRQPIVIENRGGAGTTIASAAAAKALPDGYTMLVNSPAHTIAPSLYSNLTYHPTRDFAAVAPIGVSPSVLVVAPSKTIRTAADLVKAARASAQEMTFSSVGVGSATHLSAERFRSSAAIRAMHVPFKGGAEAMAEVMAGRIDFFFGPVGLVIPYVKEGKLTALAVNTTARSGVLPDVPTLAEAGFADAEYPFWIGVFLPASTPRDIVDRLHNEIMRVLQSPHVRERLSGLGVEPLSMTASEFQAYVERALELDAKLAKLAGLQSAN